MDGCQPRAGTGMLDDGMAVVEQGFGRRAAEPVDGTGGTLSVRTQSRGVTKVRKSFPSL